MNNAQIAAALNVSPDAERRVSLILDNVQKGSDTVLTAPYAKEKTVDEILSGLDRIYNDNLSKCNEVLKDLEDSNRSKFGPMSIAKDWEERKETLYDSFGEELTSKTFKPFLLTTPQRLRPISVTSAVGYLKNNSNSGLPDVTKKKNVKESLNGYTLDDLASIIQSYLYEGKVIKELACLLFTRTQENSKTRNVWGFSIFATVFEMIFYRPILDIQSKQSWRAALRKPDDVSAGITKLIDYSIEKDLEVLSIDFSRYDNSVKYRLITSAFETISLAFQNKYKYHFNMIKDFFINCPIVTPDGILQGQHGVPSGSTFTNEVDSIVQYGIALESDAVCELSLAQVQGDDGVYSCLNSKLLIEHFKSYGLNVNDDKSYIAKNWAIFLQSLFHTDYRDENRVINGIYPIYRALNRIIHLERFDDFLEYGINGKDFFSIRTISILEQCKHHPLFKELVTYVWSLDKYKLTVSDQGLANYVRKLAIQEGKDITFRNWSYGSDIAGLKSFACVRIINELNSRV